MAKVRVQGSIQAPATEVWNTVRDFGALDSYVAAVGTCTQDGSGVGALRKLTLQDGAEVVEKLRNLDDSHRTLNYTIEEAPLPVENYLGTMQVKEEGDQSEFIWESAFEVPEDEEEAVTKAFRDIYHQGVEGLQQKFSN